MEVRGTSTLAWRRGQRQASFFLFHGAFFSALFPVALGSLTANASLDWLCFAEVYVDRDVRRLTSFLYWHLVVVKLKASMHCNSPARFTLLCCCEAAAVFWFPRLAPHWNHVWRRNQKCLFPCFFARAHPSLSAIAVGRGVAMMSASFSTGSFLSWPNSCLATSRLFAVVLLRYAETAVYVMFPSFGGLLNLALNRKHFRPKESYIDVPWISSWIFTPSGSKVLLL